MSTQNPKKPSSNERRMFCARADSPLTTEGASFDRKCFYCDKPVMIAPSGQQLITLIPDMEIVCLQCMELFPEAAAEMVELQEQNLAAPLEEILREVRTLKRNLKRNDRSPVPKWAVGMEMIMAGVYIDDDQAMHIDADELCRSVGVPATEANVFQIRKSIEQSLASTGRVQISEES